MSEENPRVKREIEVAEKREVDGVREEQVAAVVKQIKKGKSVGPDEQRHGRLRGEQL